MRFVAPARKQPKVLDAIKSGYETMANHAYLVLFPFLLDLYFMFGKRYLISDQVRALFDGITFPPSTSADMLKTWEEFSAYVLTTLEHFSLSAFLRSFPIGIPSLLAYRPLEVNPLGGFEKVQLASFGQVVLTVLGFSLIGFLLGAIFLLAIRYAVRGKKAPLIPSNLGRQMMSLLAIPLSVVLVAIFILTPALFLVSVLNAILPFLGTIGYFFLSLIIISFTIPVVFTAHDILLYGNNFLTAARQSIQTVRPTNGKTSIFLFVAFLATYLTNFLWQIPEDDSYMLLISILGHALVTTTFLIASFYFYIDARKSVRESLLSEAKNSEPISV